MGADATVQALLRQVQNLLLLGEGRSDDVALGVMQRQLDVGTNDIVLQFELRHARLRGSHVGHVHCALAGIAFPPPQVQRITETQRGIVVPGGAIGQLTRAIELIGRPVVALEGCVAIDLQRLGGLDHPGHGPGLTHARHRHGDAWATLYGKLDPGVELRIAIGPPPLCVRPVSVLGHTLNGLVGGQCIGIECLALWGNTSGSDAAADC
ncbi:hypothetical protein D3C85_906510 [compost metagenome]